jgi:uncharacterized OB-fold protein
VRGEGNLYSWVVVHRTAQDAFRSKVPYTVVLVALAEAPHIRFLGTLMNEDTSLLQMGTEMTVEFQRDHDGVTRPQWRLT